MAAGDIGTNLRTYLVSITAITDQVSTRVYPDVLPQNATLPAIVYRMISSVPQHAHGQTTKLKQTRFQIDCIATTRLVANATSEIVRKNLDHYNGAAGDDTVDISLSVSDRYDYEPPKDASDNGRYITSTDYMVWHDVPAVST